MIGLDVARGLYCNLSATLPPDWPGGYWWHWLVFVVIILAFVLVMIMVFIYIERKIVGRFQIRYGPNRAGPYGVLQPIADAIKVLLKEDIVPAKGDKWVHFMAPIVPFAAALMVFAVIPFQDGAVLVDLNIGVLYIIAISSLSVVGIFMAGWGSNNKYSLLGAMRTVAQMVSYEVPLVLSIVGVIVLTGSLSMNQIVQSQSIPFILLQPLGFLIYFICAAAEINRSPFDLLEAESEIIAGFHTEYSGIKFALFYLGEYGHGGCRRHPLPGWLGGAYTAPLPLVLDQDTGHFLPSPLDAQHPAPPAGRPAYGICLEVPPPPGTNQSLPYRGRSASVAWTALGSDIFKLRHRGGTGAFLV